MCLHLWQRAVGGLAVICSEHTEEKMVRHTQREIFQLNSTANPFFSGLILQNILFSSCTLLDKGSSTIEHRILCQWISQLLSYPEDNPHASLNAHLKCHLLPQAFQSRLGPLLCSSMVKHIHPITTSHLTQYAVTPHLQVLTNGSKTSGKKERQERSVLTGRFYSLVVIL